MTIGDQNCGGFSTPGSSPQPMTLVSWCINTPAPLPPVWDDAEPCCFTGFPTGSTHCCCLVGPLLKDAFSFLYTFFLPLLGSLCSHINNLLSHSWLIVFGGIQMNQVSCMSLCFLSQSVKTQHKGVMDEICPAY